MDTQNEKQTPSRKHYIPISSGKFTVSDWEKNSSVQFAASPNLLHLKEDESNKDKVDAFTKFGQFDVYDGDVMGIIDMCSRLRPELEITVKTRNKGLW